MGDIYLSPHNKTNVTTNAVATLPVQKNNPTPPIAATTAAPTENITTQPDEPAEVTSVAPRTGGYTHVVSITPLPKKNDPSGDNPTKENDQPKEKNIADAPSAIRKKYADMLGISPDDITNFSLYEFIEKWYGANYKLGGCDSTGIDCSGFAQKLYNEIYGIDLDRTAKEQFSGCKRLKHSSEAHEGDLVFFRMHGRRISHVGIYLANDYFIHASTSQGVVISNLHDDYWHKYFAGCGRIRHGEVARN